MKCTYHTSDYTIATYMCLVAFSLNHKNVKVEVHASNMLIYISVECVHIDLFALKCW